MLGPVCFNFISCLKKALRDKKLSWSITPLVSINNFYSPEHNQVLPVKPVSTNKSPFVFYMENQPTSDHTFIKVKVAKKPLRIIGISLKSIDGNTMVHKPTVAYISMWRANGFTREITSKHKWTTRPPKQSPDGYDGLLLGRIFHVSKPTRKMRKKVYNHTFDFSIPSEMDYEAHQCIMVIEKSFEWFYNREETFCVIQPYFLVDLNGPNSECDEWNL